MFFKSLSHAACAPAAAGLLVIGLGAGCGDGPTAPSTTVARPPAASGPPASATTVEITGHLWSHDAGGRHVGVGRVSGFVFSPRMGYGLPADTVAPDGSYRVVVPADSLVYLTSTAGHQPCMTAVSTTGAGEVSDLDLHVVTDRTRLGASLPPELLQQSNRVAGVAFEPQPDGSRAPIAGVWVGLDGAMGDGLIVAATLTDADGRYILCGLKHVAAPGIDVVLVAGRAPYRPFLTRLTGTADVVIDIPLVK